MRTQLQTSFAQPSLHLVVPLSMNQIMIRTGYFPGG